MNSSARVAAIAARLTRTVFLGYVYRRIVDRDSAASFSTASKFSTPAAPHPITPDGISGWNFS
jgi:hypothetical protein